MGTIILEGKFLKVELTPTSKSDPKNMICSSALSPNLTSILTPPPTLFLSHSLAHNRHYCCLLKHSFLLSFDQNPNFVWIIFYPHHDCKLYCTKQKSHFCLPGIGLEMNMWCSSVQWGMRGRPLGHFSERLSYFQKETLEEFSFLLQDGAPSGCKIWNGGSLPGTGERSGWWTKPKHHRWSSREMEWRNKICVFWLLHEGDFKGMWRHEETIVIVQMRDDDLDKAIGEVEMVISGWIQDAFRRINRAWWWIEWKLWWGRQMLRLQGLLLDGWWYHSLRRHSWIRSSAYERVKKTSLFFNRMLRRQGAEERIQGLHA